jgi:UDP-N-acetylglucosamine-lysosomal-enzyme
VPFWLDTQHPRLTVVTHDEIFVNRSHLPVFSSPAIETHLHRIPGLARYFVYFNDDVFLGAETWPDDFRTRARGQRVYLAWEIPKCNPGCMDSWIADKFCDAVRVPRDVLPASLQGCDLRTSRAPWCRVVW